MFRHLLAVTAFLGLVACSAPANLETEAPREMGDFRLGHVAVVVDSPEQGPFSRVATDEELKSGLERAIQARFGPFQGDKFYHIGVKLDLYALAMPGIPIVFSPQSVYVVTVTIWDDETQTVISEEGGKGLQVFEGLSKENLVSSGLTQSKARQIEIMSANTARAIQDYILENPEWIGLPPLPDPAPADN